MRMSAIAAGLLVFLLSSCSSFGVRTAPEPPGVEGVPSPDVAGSPDARPSALERTDLRTECRTDARPRGWIAVEYLRLGSQCPEQKDDGYNGVRLRHFAGMAPGAVLAVCADQPTPNGWLRKEAPPERVCEGARVDEGEPTAILIQRVR